MFGSCSRLCVELMVTTYILVNIVPVCHGAIMAPCNLSTLAAVNVVHVDASLQWASADGIISFRDCVSTDINTGLVLRISIGNVSIIIVNSSLLHMDVAITSNVNLGDPPPYDRASVANLTVIIENCTTLLQTASNWPASYTTSWINLDASFALFVVAFTFRSVHLQSEAVASLLANGNGLSRYPAYTSLTGFRQLTIDILNSNITIASNATPGAINLEGCRVQDVRIRIIDSTMEQSVESSTLMGLARVRSAVDNITSGRLSLNSGVEFLLLRCRYVASIMRRGGALDKRPGSTFVFMVESSNTVRRINDVERVSNLSMILQDSWIDLSSSVMSIVGMGYSAFKNGLVACFNIRLSMTATTSPSQNTSGTDMTIISMVPSDNFTLANATVIVVNASLSAVKRFGIDLTAASDQSNANANALSIGHTEGVVLNMSNVTFSVTAVNSSTSAFAQFLVKTILTILYIRGSITNATISITNATLTVDMPYYCPGMRAAVDEVGIATIMSDGGGYLIYAAMLGMSSGTVSNADISIVDSRVDVLNFPYRQKCDVARKNVVTTNAQLAGVPITIPLDVPLLIAVTISFFAVLGVDPYANLVMDAVAKNLPVTLPEDQVTKYAVELVSSTVSIVRPRLEIGQYQPPIQYTVTPPLTGVPWVNTMLRVALVYFLGVETVDNVTVTATLTDSTATTNATVLRVNSASRLAGLRVVFDRQSSHVALQSANRQFHVSNVDESPLQMAVPLLAINDTNVSSISVEFRNFSITLVPEIRLWAGDIIPPILAFHQVRFVKLVTVSVLYSTITSYNRLIGGTNITIVDKNSLEVLVGCNTWNGEDMPASKVSPDYLDLVFLPATRIADNCPELVPSPTLTLSDSKIHSLSIELPAPRGPPLTLGSTSRIIAAIGIAGGGIISTAAVFSMQRSISLLQLAKCDGPDAMYDSLDIFTNPAQLVIMGSGDGDVTLANSSLHGAPSNSDDGSATFGSAYRGAVVGNVAIFWCGSAALAFVLIFVVKYKRGRLWTVGVVAAQLRLPGNLYSLAIAPLLQPVLSTSLALAIHGLSTVDYIVSAVGFLFAAPITIGFFVVLSPLYFSAVSINVPHVERLRRDVQILARRSTESMHGKVYVRHMASLFWLRTATILFTVSQEWAPKSRNFRHYLGWWGNLFDAVRDRFVWVPCLEMVVVCVSSVTAAMMPSSKEACRAVAGVDVATNGVLLLAYVIGRPFGTLYDNAIASITCLLVTITAILIVAGFDDDSVESLADATNIISTFLLVLGLGQLLADTILFRRRTGALLWRLIQYLFPKPPRMFSRRIDPHFSLPGANISLSMDFSDSGKPQSTSTKHLLVRLAKRRKQSQSARLAFLIETICGRELE